MTTNELLARGIGHNCLSDAYELGKEDAYAEVDHLIAKMQESAESQMMFRHAEICGLIRERIKAKTNGWVELGHLCTGDLFKFCEQTYKAGHSNGKGWVTCTNVNTHKITKIHIDSPVEPLKEEKNVKKEIPPTLKAIESGVYKQGVNDALNELVKEVRLKYLGVHPDELHEPHYAYEIVNTIETIVTELKEQNNE